MLSAEWALITVGSSADAEKIIFFQFCYFSLSWESDWNWKSKKQENWEVASASRLSSYELLLVLGEMCNLLKKMNWWMSKVLCSGWSLLINQAVRDHFIRKSGTCKQTLWCSFLWPASRWDGQQVWCGPVNSGIVKLMCYLEQHRAGNFCNIFEKGFKVNLPGLTVPWPQV